MAGRFRTQRHAIAFISVKIFIGIGKRLPRKVGLFCFRRTAHFLSLFLSDYNKIITRNLTDHYGDKKTASEIRKIRYDVYDNMGATLFDLLRLPSLPHEEFNKIVKYDTTVLQEALAAEKGVVAIGGHMSCFELIPQLTAISGLPVMTIGSPLFDERITTIMEDLRRRNGVVYFDRNKSGRKAIKELKGGSIFGALIDQDATNDGVFAHFLGRLAYTPSGPIRLALKFGCPIVLFAIERLPDDTYSFHVEHFENPNTGDETKDTCLIAEAYNSFMSERIEKNPGQWVWMHRRWNRKRENLPDTPSITDYEL